MAREYIKDTRTSRGKRYLVEKNEERAMEVMLPSSLYTPILKKYEFHPEGEAFRKPISDTFVDILSDMAIIQNEIAWTATEYQEVMDEAILRIKAVEDMVAKSQERLMDFNMLCGEDSEFFHVRQLGNEDFEEKAFDENGMLTCGYTEVVNIPLEIINIQGNGMEGNEFVYRDNAYVADRAETNNRLAIIDASPSTYYEYQRFRASKRGEPYFSLVNIDESDIHCTVTLKAGDSIHSLLVQSADKDITIESVMTSEDGVDYLKTPIEKLKPNATESNYKEGENYIYGKGLLTFPASNYIQISFSTDAVSSDKIAFEYTPDINFKEGVDES